MWLFDFKIFYLAGLAVLNGNSPYLVDGFFSPFPMAVAFVPFALFPLTISYGIYLILSIWLLWKFVRWNTFWALLSFPVFFSLLVGQVDMQIALCVALFGPYAIPLIFIKPQLGFILVPFLIRKGSFRKIFIGGGFAAGILLLCFIIRPNWISEWLLVLSNREYSSRFDSSLYWLIPHPIKEMIVFYVSAIIMVIGFCLPNRRTSWTILQLFAPVTNIYSASVLAEWIGPLEVIVSWLAMIWIGIAIHNGAPMFVVGLIILIRHAPWRRFFFFLKTQFFNPG